MSKINIHRGTFLEKEELTRMIGFLNEKPEVSAIFAASLSFGLVSPGGKAGSAFKVTASTTLGAINMVGGYVIGSDLKGYRVDNQLDLPVPNDQKYYWLKVGPDSHNYENGTVQVDTSGNVSGTVNFNGIVRGQSSGVPTCIRFVKEDGSQPLNNQVYQIVDIINNNNIVLSSGVAFQAETQLRVIVLGSIPMGRRFTDEQLEGLYTFDTYKLTFVEEPSAGTMPPKNSNEYYIARVRACSSPAAFLKGIGRAYTVLDAGRFRRFGSDLYNHNQPNASRRTGNHRWCYHKQRGGDRWSYIDLVSLEARIPDPNGQLYRIGKERDIKHRAGRRPRPCAGCQDNRQDSQRWYDSRSRFNQQFSNNRQGRRVNFRSYGYDCTDMRSGCCWLQVCRMVA